MTPLLTIGIATYDDFDGLFFTVQSLRMFHPICNTDQVEFVVLDNNPQGRHRAVVQKFIQSQVGGKYVPYSSVTSSFAKYETIKHATGKYMLIIDSHVLLVDGAISNLLEYFSARPGCKNLVQGPLLYNDLANVSTHFKPGWGSNMWGLWDTDLDCLNKGEPFVIPMQGMGLASFERSNWPHISPYFKGFGGEEGYISERFRQNGGENICLPALKWVHRFDRPGGIPFRCTLEDRAWNYFIGALHLYGDSNHEFIHSIYNNFKQSISEHTLRDILVSSCVVMKVAPTFRV